MTSKSNEENSSMLAILGQALGMSNFITESISTNINTDNLVFFDHRSKLIILDTRHT